MFEPFDPLHLWPHAGMVVALLAVCAIILAGKLP